MKLAPCPFCASIVVESRLVFNAEGAGVEVWCTTCGAEGPEVNAGLLSRDVKPKHRREAEKRWNTRAANGAETTKGGTT